MRARHPCNNNLAYQCVSSRHCSRGFQATPGASHNPPRRRCRASSRPAARVAIPRAARARRVARARRSASVACSRSRRATVVVASDPFDAPRIASTTRDSSRSFRARSTARSIPRATFILRAADGDSTEPPDGVTLDRAGALLRGQVRGAPLATNIVTPLLTMTDTAFVGRCAVDSVVQLAALGVSTPLTDYTVISPRSTLGSATTRPSRPASPWSSPRNRRRARRLPRALALPRRRPRALSRTAPRVAQDPSRGDGHRGELHADSCRRDARQAISPPRRTRVWWRERHDVASGTPVTGVRERGARLDRGGGDGRWRRGGGVGDVHRVVDWLRGDSQRVRRKVHRRVSVGELCWKDSWRPSWPSSGPITSLVFALLSIYTALILLPDPLGVVVFAAHRRGKHLRRRRALRRSAHPGGPGVHAVPPPGGTETGRRGKMATLLREWVSPRARSRPSRAV